VTPLCASWEKFLKPWAPTAQGTVTPEGVQQMGTELERLSAQVEVSPIFRTHGGLMLSREAKELQADVRRAVARRIVGKVDIEVVKEVGKDAMDAACDLDDYRRLRAHGDDALNSILARVELVAVQQINEAQRRAAGNMFGL